MRKNDLPAALGRIRKMRAKAVGVLLAVTLVTASFLPSSVTATEAGNGSGTEAAVTPEAENGPDEPEVTETPTSEEGVTETSDPESGEGVTGTPDSETGEEDTEASDPASGEEDEEELTPTPKPRPTPTPEPSEEPEEEITPTPTGKPKATPTPKPTKKPKATPTPKPGGADDPDAEPTGDPDAESTGDPDTELTEDPDAEPTEEPTPTPTPAPVYPIEVPTESNDARYQYLFGINAREITIHNPIPGYESGAAVERHLRKTTVKVWKMKASGEKYSSTYSIMVHEKLARNIKAIFNEIYDLEIQFPIKEMKAYTYYRKVGGVGLSNTTLISPHSFGAAIDINPGDFDNDYYLGKGNDLRDKSNPYCIPDEVIEIFAKYGWFWGGDFDICADTMHFQYLGLDSLSYQNNPPFRTLKVQRGYMKGIDVRNLQQRLCEVGYKVTIDGVYGNKTSSAVKKYQKNRGLPATGVVDYKTWETIINETHYMSYVF